MSNEQRMNRVIGIPKRDPDFVHGFEEVKIQVKGWIINKNKVVVISYRDSIADWRMYMIRLSPKYPWIEVEQHSIKHRCSDYIDNELSFVDSPYHEFYNMIEKEIANWMLNKEIEKTMKAQENK